jgi:glycosyltransferase involved in cell wall biosynthesis
MRPVLRLAYVTTLPVAQWGFLRGQNTFLSEHGFELHAIASPGRWLDMVAQRDGAVVHAVPISRTIAPLHDLVSLWRLFRVFRRVRPHMAHVSTPKAALLGSAAAWAARVPVTVFCFRGSITEPASGLQRRMFRTAERLTARLCDQTICVSPSLLEFARSESIVARGSGMVPAKGMSNGIDVHRFDPDTVPPAETTSIPPSLARAVADPSAVVIGYVGRLAYDKGIEVLTGAWLRLRAQHANVHLVLVGPWEQPSSVSAACRHALQQDERVHVIGDVLDVVPYYRLMSLFVFPSLGSEGFPNAPMEAAAMRLPVIATRVVGSVDAVEDGATGTLVPPRDTAALTEAMRMYVGDAALRRTHGEAGRARVVADFRQETIWQAIYDEYVALLSRHGLTADRDDAASRPDVIGQTHEQAEW